MRIAATHCPCPMRASARGWRARRDQVPSSSLRRLVIRSDSLGDHLASFAIDVAHRIDHLALGAVDLAFHFRIEPSLRRSTGADASRKFTRRIDEDERMRAVLLVDELFGELERRLRLSWRRDHV